jgi:hypothetical protein
MNLPIDILFELVDGYLDIQDIQKFSLLNKELHYFCKNNSNIFSKRLLNNYQVNYKDPGNFIYRINNKNINDYKINNIYKYPSILKLYMKYYYIDKINCSCLNISSFPIYPNMTHFYGDDNQLTTFSIQPKMIHFYGSNNKLTTIPIQPKMIHFSLFNPITFYGKNNALTTFPIQPNMTHFYGLDNKLTAFTIQPDIFLWFIQ